MKKNEWVLVSFFTPDYKDVAERLLVSVKKHKIKSFEVDKCDPQIGGFGDKKKTRFEWKLVTLFKADFIYKKMQKYNDGVGIVWIDADAVISKYPKLFDTITQDVGVHYRKHWGGRKELLSGTIYFKNSRKTRKLVKQWAELNMINNLPDKSDQLNLQSVLDKSKLKILDLPPSYTQIYDTMAGNGEPVIEHFQESRKYRRPE